MDGFYSLDLTRAVCRMFGARPLPNPNLGLSGCQMHTSLCNLHRYPSNALYETLGDYSSLLPLPSSPTPASASGSIGPSSHSSPSWSKVTFVFVLILVHALGLGLNLGMDLSFSLALIAHRTWEHVIFVCGIFRCTQSHPAVGALVELLPTAGVFICGLDKHTEMDLGNAGSSLFRLICPLRARVSKLVLCPSLIRIFDHEPAL